MLAMSDSKQQASDPAKEAKLAWKEFIVGSGCNFLREEQDEHGNELREIAVSPDTVYQIMELYKKSLRSEIEKRIAEYKADNIDSELDVMVEQFGILRMLDEVKPL